MPKYIHPYVNGQRFHVMILSPQEWKFYGRGEYFTFMFSPGGCSYYVGEDYISHRQLDMDICDAFL